MVVRQSCKRMSWDVVLVLLRIEASPGDSAGCLPEAFAVAEKTRQDAAPLVSSGVVELSP